MAARCFEDVIELIASIAFAHYFLAKAYEKIGGKEAKMTENLARYESIIAKNETWRSHADHFGLTGQPRFTSPANMNLIAPELALVSSAH